MEKLKAALAEHARLAAGWEADTQRLETVLTALDESLREQEAASAQAREQIKASETTLGHEGSLSVGAGGRAGAHSRPSSWN